MRNLSLPIGPTSGAEPRDIDGPVRPAHRVWPRKKAENNKTHASSPGSQMSVYSAAHPVRGS